MIARIVRGRGTDGGTDMTFPVESFIEHAIEDEPGRFSLIFERQDKTDYQIESCKDLFVYLMNENGKTIDRRIYRS